MGANRVGDRRGLMYTDSATGRGLGQRQHEVSALDCLMIVPMSAIAWGRRTLLSTGSIGIVFSCSYLAGTRIDSVPVSVPWVPVLVAI